MTKTLIERLEPVEQRFADVSTLTFSVEQGFALQHLKSNSYLDRAAHSQPDSLLQAMANCAAVGLSLNPAEKLAYLIPRNVKDGNKYVTRVFYEPSYIGMIRLATNTGSIEWVQSAIVNTGDTFTLRGVSEEPQHERDPFAASEGIKGAYCVAKTKSGDFLTTVMSYDEICGIRDRSESWKAYQAGKAKSGGPWESDFGEQAKKTVIRRAFKTWPRTDQHAIEESMALAVHLSNENEGFTQIVGAPEGMYDAEQKAYFDQCISRSNALGIYSMRRTLPETVYTNLYHSFPKGEKGKWQRAVEQMETDGQAAVEQYRQSLAEAFGNGDTAGIAELASELSEDEATVILDGLPIDVTAVFNKLKEAAA